MFVRRSKQKGTMSNSDAHEGSDVPENGARSEPANKRTKHETFMNRFRESSASLSTAATAKRAAVASAAQSFKSASQSTELAKETIAEAAAAVLVATTGNPGSRTAQHAS
jgi:hypothetical protein